MLICKTIAVKIPVSENQATKADKECLAGPLEHAS